MKKSVLHQILVVTAGAALISSASCSGKPAATSSMPEPADSPALQNASSGAIDRLYVWSPELGDTVTVDVWLPNGYEADNSRRYPVIYMHDGQNLFDASTTWNHQSWDMDSVTGALIAQGKIEAPVIVGIHSVSESRIGDLMPEDAINYLDDESDTLKTNFTKRSSRPIRGNAYARFIATTLKQGIDTLYRTLPDRAHTSVMGSSMGGLMSLYAMCEYPDVFGNAACLSTHWVGVTDGNPAFAEAMEKYTAAKLPDPASHRLYLDRGTTTIDSLYGPAQSRMIALVRSRGYEMGATLDTLTADGAPHEERAWNARVHRPLTFLLGTSPR